MNFSLSQTNFPSVTHQSIWHAAVMRAAFYEIIPASLSDGEADELREGQRSLYQFMTDLYSDMYEHPEAYELPVGDYEAYMQGRTRRDLSHKGDPKESRLRNRFQQGIQFYQKLLFEIGAKADQEADSQRFTLNSSVLSEMINSYNLRLIRGEEQRRASHLARLGLEIRFSIEKMTIANDQYPHMLSALTALCRSNTGKHALSGFLRCDFRALESYKPGFADAVQILPDDFKSTALELNDYMKEINAKDTVQPLKNTTLFSPWKLGYSRNGKSVYGFHADTDSFETYVYFNYFSNVSRMGYLLKETSPKLYDWFNDRFPTRTCACPNNKLADIGGCKKRICGLMNRLEVYNPSTEDLRNLKLVIELSLEKIWKL